MVALHSITYTKSQLAAVPEHERIMHFMLLGVSNDVSILQRSIIINSMPGNGEHEAVSAGRRATSIMLAKILAGRLYEGWNVMRSPKHAKVKQTFAANVPPQASAALVELGRYFGRDNLVNLLRKKVAFHLDVEAFQAAYDALPDEHKFVDYHATIVGNTFYGGAAETAAAAMGRLGHADNIGAGLDRAMDEILYVSHRMTEYIGGFALAFALAYLNLDKATFANNVIDIPAPRLATARAPFFYEADASDLPEVRDAFQ